MIADRDPIPPWFRVWIALTAPVRVDRVMIGALVVAGCVACFALAVGA